MAGEAIGRGTEGYIGCRILWNVPCTYQGELFRSNYCNDVIAMVLGQNPTGQKPIGQYPSGQNPRKTKTQEDKIPWGQKPRGTKIQVRQKPRGTKAQGDKTPQGQKPMEDNIQADNIPGGQNPKMFPRMMHDYIGPCLVMLRHPHPHPHPTSTYITL